MAVEEAKQDGVSKPVQSQCTIPYPDRFHAAVKYINSLQDAGAVFSDEVRLLFYALGQQATIGSCMEPKPWGWQVVESAKWSSWSQLGNMSKMEAMRLFVKTLEEVKPDWWAQLPPDMASSAGRTGASPNEPVSLADIGVAGGWVSLEMDGAPKPLPRYEQGAAMVGNKLYIIGGHVGGRYLSDVWAFDLGTLQWTQVEFQLGQTASDPQAAESGSAAGGGAQDDELTPMLHQLPPSAGHSVTHYQGKLLVLGGHLRGRKAGKKLNPPGQMLLWQLDLAASTVTRVTTTGDSPCARGGHSACLVGSKLWVFGGEDSNRRPLSDLWQLDLPTWAWTQLTVNSKQQPQPRSGHTAATYQDKLLLLFGGGSLANCFNDCWALDLESLEWSQPLAFGDVPTARAGHCGVICEDVWYIIGGGNNVKGCTDMLAADLSELSAGHITWNRSNIVPTRSVLSSEGISLVHVKKIDALLAFGGYNGKYNNIISLYKPQTSASVPEGKHANSSSSSFKEQPASSSSAAPASTQQQQQQQQQKQQRPPQQQPQQQEPGGRASPSPFEAVPSRPGSAAAAAATCSAEAAGASTPEGQPSPQANGTAKSHEQSLLRELAISREQLKKEVAAAKAEAAAAAEAVAAAQESAAHELALMRRQLAAAQAGLAETEKALEECRHQLSAEQAKTLKLEGQLAEARSKLGEVEALERELARYKQEQQDSSAKKGGGLWGYLAGSGGSQASLG